MYGLVIVQNATFFMINGFLHGYAPFLRSI